MYDQYANSDEQTLRANLESITQQYFSN